MEEGLLLKRKRMEEDQRLLQRILDGAEDPTDLPLALLKDITNDFSEERKIGEGAFGAVYKGVLGELTVAVKRIHINESTVDDRLFRREFVSLWNTTNHRNVVRFLGICSNTYQKPIEDVGSGEITLANILERLLCFEYVSNGSLDKHITDELRGLEWETRYEIITGICKGLRYLHEEKNIIHMDLKPANILIHHQDDKYFVPKITDFGLSRPNKNTHTVGLCFGTLEYMAPEYREERKTTTTCDIYSLGLIIIELVTGSKGIPDENSVLRRWRHRWNKPPTQLQYHQVTRCIYMAKQCRKKTPEARPSISKIIGYLNESENMDGQISPCLDQDDMLRITPVELRIPSALKNETSRSVELTNNTLNCIAFNIQQQNVKYIVEPVKGTVQPKSKRYVKVTVQPRDVCEHNHADKFIVQSMKWGEGLSEEDITERISRVEAQKVVDEVDLMVLYDTTKPRENCKCVEDTNMTTEDVPEAKRRKIDVPAFVKGNNEIGRNENAHASYVDISSSAQGQCTEQEQCNLHPLQSFLRHSPTNQKYLGKKSPVVNHTSGAMGSLLDKLGKLLTVDYSLNTTITSDIESFSVQLTKIHLELPTLKNVDGVEVLVNEVRELSYKIEDMVDSFLVHVEPDSSWCGFREITRKGLNLLVNGMPTHHQIDDVIRDIKHQVQAMVHRKEEYNFKVKDFVADMATIDPRMGIYRKKDQLFGIEEPIHEVISLLEEDNDVSNQELRLVSIVGMGGLGKTTLAKAVYDKLQAQYDLKIFVSVGQNRDMVLVLKEICRKFEMNLKTENLNMTELIEELHKFLEDKRYFIVIDDIWEDSIAWVQSALPENNCGSRVITTTRIRRVALACCNYDSKYVYEIKPLSDEDSKKLFFRRIFGSRKDCYVTPRKEEISKYILERCRGMPLAINSIASLLAGGKDSTWEYVLKSLGAMTQGDDLRIMVQILDLSYIHLPDHLKTCLLYVCIYPEGREIDKIDLLRQWAAEGFVSRNGVLDAEDVAEQYFEELINMCMIQPWDIDYCNNEVLSCRVHDIILDLMRSKSSKDNFFHVIDGLKDVSGQIRRVSVHHNDKEDTAVLETIKGSIEHVRSVFLYRPSLLPDFLKYKYVRVLHLDHATCPYLDLTGISRLLLLVYLKVACSRDYTFVDLKLPDQIGQLQQLETIDLEGCELKNYPPDIITLPWLSCLRYIGHSGIPLPDGINKLKSLHTLVGVCLMQSSVDNLKGLGELTNLRNLQMASEWYRKSDEEAALHMNALHSSISRLSTSLRILYLFAGLSLGHDLSRWSRTLFPQGSHIRKLFLSGFSFQRCPEWIGQLHNLYSLSIRVREVAGGISIVEGLPSLAYFKFSTDLEEETEQEIVVISGGGGAFPALKHLIFDCVKTSLSFEEGALPKLETLKILLHKHTYRSFVSAVGIEHLPAPNLKRISLEVLKSNGDCYPYEHSEVTDLLEREIKEHHPGAEIYISFVSDKYAEEYCSEPSEEDDEAIGDQGDYSSEGGDEGACQVSESQTSEQVQANTRQVELSGAAQEDSCRMGTNTPSRAVSLGDLSWAELSDEDDRDVGDEEECCNEEAAEAANQVSGSETSAQVQANARQVELINAQEDSGRMSTNTIRPVNVTWVRSRYSAK